MTPQEKAEELYEAFMVEVQDSHNATVCALITVNEIVIALQNNGDAYWSSEYWEDVKKAINEIN